MAYALLRSLRTARPMATPIKIMTMKQCALHTTRRYKQQAEQTNEQQFTKAEQDFRKTLEPQQKDLQQSVQEAIEKIETNDKNIHVTFNADGTPRAAEPIKALAQAISNLRAIELKMLSDELGKIMGFSPSMLMGMAAPAQAAPAAAPAGAAAAETAAAPAKPVEEKKVFNLVLASFEAKDKIKVIKEVRALTGLGLKESKEFVESTLPKVMKKDVPKADAETLVGKFKDVGAVIKME